MTYIIQNRIVRILYNDRDFSEQLKQLIFPSQRNEHQKPIFVIRLLIGQYHVNYAKKNYMYLTLIKK